MKALQGSTRDMRTTVELDFSQDKGWRTWSLEPSLMTLFLSFHVQSVSRLPVTTSKIHSEPNRFSPPPLLPPSPTSYQLSPSCFHPHMPPIRPQSTFHTAEKHLPCDGRQQLAYGLSAFLRGKLHEGKFFYFCSMLYSQRLSSPKVCTVSTK